MQTQTAIAPVVTTFVRRIWAPAIVAVGLGLTVSWISIIGYALVSTMIGIVTSVWIGEVTARAVFLAGFLFEQKWWQELTKTCRRKIRRAGPPQPFPLAGNPALRFKFWVNLFCRRFVASRWAGRGRAEAVRAGARPAL